MDDDFLLSVIGNEDSNDVLCVDKFIGDSTLEHLIVKLKCNPRVTSQKTRLVLRGNCLTSVGALKLSSFLKENTSFQFVSLEWNQIGSGAIYIGEALKDNYTITHLDLRNNSITDTDVITLAKVLENDNKSLKILDLRWNQLTDKGVEIFRNAVMHRLPPLIVHFSGNHLTPSVMNQVDEWILKINMDRDKNNHSHEMLINTSFTSQSQQQQSQLQIYRNGQPDGDYEADNIDEDDYYDTDLPSQQKLFMQMKIKNSLLRKEIQSMRHQNIYLQTSVTSLENQLSTDSLHVTELEQNLINERYKVNQMNQSMNELLEKVTKLETHQHETVVFHSELVRGKDNEIKTLLQEKSSFKLIIDQSQENFTRERLQLNAVIDMSEKEKTELHESLRQTQAKLAEISNEEARVRAENNSLNATLNRLKEKLQYTEEEFLVSQQASEESLLAEMHRHDTELEQQRMEINSIQTHHENRILKLIEEISFIRIKSLDNEQSLSSQMIVLQQACDERVERVRSSEEERTAMIIQDLKNRLEMATLSWKEVENRNIHNLKEISDTSKQHSELIQHMKSQTSQTRDEIHRLQQLSIHLQDQLSIHQQNSIIQQTELEVLKNQSTLQLEQLINQKKVIFELMSEKQLLNNDLIELKNKYQTCLKSKQFEFEMIQEKINHCLLQEFENLKVRFIVPQTESVVLPSSSSSSSSSWSMSSSNNENSHQSSSSSIQQQQPKQQLVVVPLSIETDATTTDTTTTTTTTTTHDANDKLDAPTTTTPPPPPTTNITSNAGPVITYTATPDINPTPVVDSTTTTTTTTTITTLPNKPKTETSSFNYNHTTASLPPVTTSATATSTTTVNKTSARSSSSSKSSRSRSNKSLMESSSNNNANTNDNSVVLDNDDDDDDENDDDDDDSAELLNQSHQSQLSISVAESESISANNQPWRRHRGMSRSQSESENYDDDDDDDDDSDSHAYSR